MRHNDLARLPVTFLDRLEIDRADRSEINYFSIDTLFRKVVRRLQCIMEGPSGDDSHILIHLPITVEELEVIDTSSVHLFPHLKPPPRIAANTLKYCVLQPAGLCIC
jgi:hypothetical protein